MTKKGEPFAYQLFFRAEEDACQKCKDKEEYYFDEIPTRPHPNCRCQIEWVWPKSPNEKPKPVLGDKADKSISEETETRELITFKKTSECVDYLIDEPLEVTRDMPDEIKKFEESDDTAGKMDSYRNVAVLTHVPEGKDVTIYLVITYRVVTISVPMIVRFEHEGKKKEYIQEFIEGEIKVPVEATTEIEFKDE